MLKHSGTGWTVAWGKRIFFTARPEYAHVDAINPPVFKRKQDAQFFADVKIDRWKKAGWFSEKDAQNVKLVKVKSSVELI